MVHIQPMERVLDDAYQHIPNTYYVLISVCPETYRVVDHTRQHILKIHLS